MTNHETPCTDPSPELRDALLAYLYDEGEPEERQQVEQHVTECRHCAEELESLRSVRGTLAAWTPPDPAFGFRVIGQPESPAVVVATAVGAVMGTGGRFGTRPRGGSRDRQCRDSV